VDTSPDRPADAGNIPLLYAIAWIEATDDFDCKTKLPRRHLAEALRKMPELHDAAPALRRYGPV
jgi:hypothetical protein